jgi:nitrate reductase beta subunit
VYAAHLEMLLDPTDEEIRSEAASQGIPPNFIQAAEISPIYPLAKLWKLALPLHPEYRTLPMVWYVPPISPVVSFAQGEEKGDIIDTLRIPVAYLANLLAAGDEAPVRLSLKRLLALRQHMRSLRVEKKVDGEGLEKVGLTVKAAQKMYRLLALSRLNERFVIPTAGRTGKEGPFQTQGTCGFADQR